MKCHTTSTSWLMLTLKGYFSILSRKYSKNKVEYSPDFTILVTPCLDQYPSKLNSENKNEGGGSIGRVVILETLRYLHMEVS